MILGCFPITDVVGSSTMKSPALDARKCGIGPLEGECPVAHPTDHG